MKKTILIAEDDKKIAAALQIRLKAAGYHAVTAPDGFRGFMLAASRRPDLILMDIFMPFGDGIKVAESLAELGCPEIPIIFLTASKKEGLWMRAQEVGGAAFFEKPFDMEKLLTCIDRTLSAHEQKPHGDLTTRQLKQTIT